MASSLIICREVSAPLIDLQHAEQNVIGMISNKDVFFGVFLKAYLYPNTCYSRGERGSFDVSIVSERYVLRGNQRLVLQIENIIEFIRKTFKVSLSVHTFKIAATKSLAFSHYYYAHQPPIAGSQIEGTTANATVTKLADAALPILCSWLDIRLDFEISVVSDTQTIVKHYAFSWVGPLPSPLEAPVGRAALTTTNPPEAQEVVQNG